MAKPNIDSSHLESAVPPSDREQRVAVCRWDWLPPSETFVRRQCDSLERYVAVPVGTVLVDSTLVRGQDRIVYRSVLGRRLFARLFHYFGAGRAFGRLLKRERVDLVHVHFATDAARLARSVRTSRLPLVVTLHGFDVTRAPRDAGWRADQYRRRLRALFRSPATFIAVSEAIAEQARGLGAPKDRVIVHYMGIEVGPLASTADAEWDVIFVGRLVEKKGVDDLIRALAVADGQGRRLRACIVGTGQLEGSLHRLAGDLGVEVSFTGHRSPDAVREVMSRSLVLALPSKTGQDGDMEGLPTVAMEAMSLGLPVVATRHSGIPEIIEDGVSGLLSDEQDVEALAANILRLVDDSRLRADLRAGARRTIEERFDVRLQTRKLELLYDRCLAPARR